MSTALSVTQPVLACSEHELVAAVKRGDDQAFEELYSRYRDRIGAYVLGMVGDHGRAEDVAQEVFISALRRLRDTERPIVFKPWIYEIAKNACIDEFRRTRRVQEVPLPVDEAAERANPRLVAHSASADAAVETKQRLDDLRGAFRGLSESHHKVLVMRELGGLSYGQIGDRLGMSTPVVESTLFRARRRLGQEYDELVSGRRCAHVQTVIDTGGERPLRALGLRERRQLARHLSHCQPCRRHARMAGVEESFFQVPSVIGKIAALLPFPWLRWRRSRGDEAAIAGAGSHQLATLQSLQMAAQYADPSMPAVGLGRAAATVAVIVAAGAGGGVVSGLGPHADRLGTRGAGLLLAVPARAHASNGPARRGPAGYSVSYGTASPFVGAGGVPSAQPAAGVHASAAAPGVASAPAGANFLLRAPGAAVAGAAGRTGVLGGLHLPGSKSGSATGGGSPLPKLPKVGLPSVSSLTGSKPPLPLPKLQLHPLPQVRPLSLPGLGLPPLRGLSFPDPAALVSGLGHRSP